MRNLPKSSERKDYKAMDDGFAFGDDGKERSLRASAEKLTSQRTEDDENNQKRKDRENARKAAEELLQMREEYEALEEEDDLLRRQKAEADNLRQR